MLAQAQRAVGLKSIDRYIATMRLSLEAKDARIAELEARLAEAHKYDEILERWQSWLLS